MPDEGHLKTFGDALRHRAWLLLAILGVFLLGAGALIVLMPRTYEGRAQLFIDVRWNVPQEFDVAVQASEHLTRYYLLQVTSRSVLERAIRDLALSDTPAGLARRVDGKVVKGTSLIEVRARAVTPGAAQTLANGVAAAVVEQNKADVSGRLAATKKYLDSELSRLDAAMQQAQAAIQDLQRQVVPPNSPAAANAQQAAISARQIQLTGLQNQYDRTYARSQELALAQTRGVDALAVAEGATLPTRPVRPDPVTYLASALVLGLLLGLFVVLLLERFDDRLFTAERLALATGTSLAINVARRSSPSSVTQPNPYVLALANLRARYPKAHTVLMAGASTADHAGLVAAELGAVSAGDGQRVLVVESDGPGAPSTGPGPQGSSATTIAVQSEAELRALLDRINHGAKQFDLVLLSMPSPERSPLALGVAQASDFGILVATAGHTRYADAERTANTLRRAGVDLGASVLLAKRPRASSQS